MNQIPLTYDHKARTERLAFLEDLKRKKDDDGFIFLTPELAALFIDKFNLKNRPLSEKRIEQIMKGIHAWVKGAQTINFDTDGFQFNAQHTCHAVARTGVAVHVYLCTGGHPKAIKFMDQVGSSRSISDQLVAERPQLKSNRHHARIAATTHVMIRLLGYEGEDDTRTDFMHAITSCFDEYEAELTLVADTINDRTVDGDDTGASAARAAFTFIHRCSPIKAQDFAHRYITKEGLEKNDNVIAVHRWLKEDERTNEEVVAALLTAFRRDLEGTTTKKLSPEPIKKILQWAISYKTPRKPKNGLRKIAR